MAGQRAEPDEGAERIATDFVNGAVKVHATLGAGLLERPYQLALAGELELRGWTAPQRVPIIASDEGATLANAYLADLLVGGRVVVEAKSNREGLHSANFAQLLTYLRFSDHRLGFLINFSRPRIAIRRVVHSRQTTDAT